MAFMFYLVKNNTKYLSSKVTLSPPPFYLWTMNFLNWLALILRAAISGRDKLSPKKLLSRTFLVDVAPQLKCVSLASWRRK